MNYYCQQNAISDLPDWLELEKGMTHITGTFTAKTPFRLVARNTSKTNNVKLLFGPVDTPIPLAIINIGPGETFLEPNLILPTGEFGILLQCVGGTQCSGWAYPIFIKG